MSVSSASLIEIRDLSHDGRGIGRTAAGKTCFVAGALPGELVRWSQQRSRRTYAEGTCVAVERPAPERVTPRCAWYARCGGCELQHLDAAAQLNWKQRQLQATLQRAGLEVAEWAPALSAAVWNYRRRTRLAVQLERGELRLGYRARGSREVVDIARCDVLDARLNAWFDRLRALAGELMHLGLEQIELSVAGEDIALCLMLKRPLADGAAAALCEQLHPAQLWQKLPQQGARPLADYPPLRSKLVDGLEMAFTPGQFVQVNEAMNTAMLEQAIAWLEPQAGHRVLDLYCGSGNFSLPLARRAATLVGVEGSAELCEQARYNAGINGLDNLRFHVRDLSDPAGPRVLGKERFDRVLLDPPREGAAALMPWLRRLGAERILYVSCHPATLVRDLAALGSGYRIRRLGALDMFPHTTHLEAMALLERV